ncbi:PREDICTED: UPF0481 [Prunus dulcis]|uniref:PREDICTED: UPF0481 n=1 Tax=Prunus dulcis TaxID=3755 RepID=A0A5E4GAE8_PRUDU|nr:PREDICTED: UPF0481 [Prunus dulcis]
MAKKTDQSEKKNATILLNSRSSGAIEPDIDFVKRKAVEQDLILFENQLPYPLLQELYDFANPSYSSSNHGKNVQEKKEADDLQHCFPCFQPCFPISRSTPSDDHPIKIEKTEPYHPFLTLTCEFFREYTKSQPIENGVQVKHFTDLLVDTVEDVNVLIESEVIVNLLCNSDAVAKLINSLCEQIMDSRSCYTDICKQLNKHYEISFCNRNISILKQVYFKDLWTGSSTILGLFVLVFSIIRTIKSLMS